MTLKRRMLVNILSVVAISAGVSALMGSILLRWHLQQQAANRVKQDLNAAQEFYVHRLSLMKNALEYTVLGERFSQAVSVRDVAYLGPRLEAVRQSAGLDMLTLLDAGGKVIRRAHHADLFGDSLEDEPLIRTAAEHSATVCGTVLIPMERLRRESPALAARAALKILPTPKAIPSDRKELSEAMCLTCAVPVRDDAGRIAGILRSWVMLNGNYDLVDRVRDTVFREERYRGKLIGTATIFQNDVRISTNVERDDGSRAVGTRVSREVYEHVLGRGKTWIGSAWVVNDWYISAYDPIRDVRGTPIGMLYVGVRERKFSDLALQTFTLYVLAIVLGLAGAGVVGWNLANRISRPVRTLADAAAAISAGDLDRTVEVKSRDEIGLLTKSFNSMARSLKERDDMLREHTRQQLSRSERLASVGRLAAGIAHEINNPLTGVLTFAHMLRKDVQEDSQAAGDLDTIIESTTRCKEIVRGLLDFSRQSELKKRPTDLNEVLREAMKLTRNQALVKSVGVKEYLAAHLPAPLADPNQMEQVAVNLMCNAIDAMPEGGVMTVRSRESVRAGRRHVEFDIGDTGCGIPEENLDQVFDPFFTTKPAGKGTGLGLAVAYGIVEEHGGDIRISSREGVGTTVTVVLPLEEGVETDDLREA